MQIVPEMDTVLNIGGSGNTGKNENENAEGFMGILMNTNSKFSQMLKEDPKLVLAGLELMTDGEQDGKEKTSVENLIMTAGWTDFIPGMTEDVRTVPETLAGNGEGETTEEIMIGGRQGSLYGKMHVASGKTNPMITGSSLLRSFGLARNPQRQEGVMVEPKSVDTMERETMNPTPEAGLTDSIKVSKEVAEALKVRMAEIAGSETTGNFIGKATTAETVKNSNGEPRSIPDDGNLFGRAGMIRMIRTDGTSESRKLDHGNPGNDNPENGNGSGNRTIIRNAGKFVSELVRELNESNPAKAVNTVEMANDADRAVIRELTEHLMNESLRPEGAGTKGKQQVANEVGSSEKNVPAAAFGTEGNTGNIRTGTTDGFEAVAFKNNVMKQLVEKVNLQKLEDGSSINVKLRPDSLGGITISLGMSARGLTATIAATNTEVQAALEGSIEQLALVLADYGISRDRIDVVPGEGYYGEQDSNGFMFDDGNSNQGHYARPGHKTGNMETIEEESAKVRGLGKGTSIIDMYG